MTSRFNTNFDGAVLPHFAVVICFALVLELRSGIETVGTGHSDTRER